MLSCWVIQTRRKVYECLGDTIELFPRRSGSGGDLWFDLVDFWILKEGRKSRKDRIGMPFVPQSHSAGVPNIELTKIPLLMRVANQTESQAEGVSQDRIMMHIATLVVCCSRVWWWDSNQSRGKVGQS